MDVKSRVFAIICFIGIGISSIYSTPGHGQEGVPEKNIDVVLGIDKIQKLDFAPSTKIQVGNESILSYQLIPQKREIILKGVKAGKTSMIIRNTVGDIKARYLVRITADSQSKTIAEIKEFLGDIEGLEINIKGGKVVVEGQLVVPSDIGRISIILDRYPDVIRLIELSPQSQRVIASKMQEEIQKNGMKNVTVRIVNRVFWLEGVVGSNGQKVLALKIAEGYLPDRIADLSSKAQEIQKVKKRAIQSFISVNAKQKPAPPPKIIKVISQFVELTKDYAKLFGFKWEPLLSGSGGFINFGKTDAGDVTTQSEGTLSGTISNLFPKLQSAKNAGHARVMQSGMILVKNRTKGKISKNTSVPFSLGSGEFTRSETASTGLSIDITPTIIGGERIEMAVGIGVNISAGSTAAGAPVTINNNVSTTVIVKSKESAVIGGVVFNESNTAYDKDPGVNANLSSVASGTATTPLFSFIRSKTFRSAKSQFVVFLTPSIVESTSAGVNKVRQKFRRRRN